MNIPRRFTLTEHGTVVAHGVVWGDSSCSVRWYLDKDHFSTVHWPDVVKGLENSFQAYDFAWIDEANG